MQKLLAHITTSKENNYFSLLSPSQWKISFSLFYVSLSLFMLMWAFIPSSSLTVESISWPEQRRCRSKPSQTAFQFHRPDTARKAVRRVDVAEARMISWAGEPAERGKERKGESVYVCVKERERERGGESYCNGSKFWHLRPSMSCFPANIKK